MSITRKYYSDYHLMLTRVSGRFDDTQLVEHVNEMNAAVAGIRGIRELADCRTLNDISGLTVNGTTNSARMENDMPGSMLAILVPAGKPLIFGMARAYQMFSMEHRAAVEIFTDLEEAIRWLGFDDMDIMSIVRIVNNG